jgi:hypothetical protein
MNHKIKKINPINGYIPCVNLCTESFSNVIPDKFTHVCNLASINMGSIRDFEHLAEVARTTTRMLDYGITMTNNPTEETYAHNQRYRTIGIGVMGLHDYLAREFKSYRNLDLIREIFECIEWNAIAESVELAKQFGSFGAFEQSTWKSGERIARFKEHASGKWDWDWLQAQIDLYGLRNSQVSSPAPTTSCHSLDDGILTCNGITDMRTLFSYSGYQEEDLLKMSPQWIPLKQSIFVPDTLGGTSEVSRLFWNGVEETIEIEFEDGAVYSFTANHKLLVRKNDVDSWVRCDMLEDGMDIIDIGMTRHHDF